MAIEARDLGEEGELLHYTTVRTTSMGKLEWELADNKAEGLL